MAILSFGMMQSLDGYIDPLPGQPGLPMPDDVLHRHFGNHVASLSGILYGSRMYEVMRYWDDDRPDDGDLAAHFAKAWRPRHKWVFSQSLNEVGPNATLVREDAPDFVRKLKEELDGEIEVAGPELAGSLTAAGLIDKYHLYLQPCVLGGGKPFFAGARPPLRLVASERIGETAIRLTYVPE